MFSKFQFEREESTFQFPAEDFVKCFSEVDTSVFYQADGRSLEESEGSFQSIPNWLYDLPDEFSSISSEVLPEEPQASFSSSSPSFISRLFSFVSQQFTSSSARARKIGISARETIRKTIRSIFSFLKIAFQKFHSFLNSVEQIFSFSIDSILDQIQNYVTTTFSSFKGIIISMISIVLCLISFMLPSSAISMYGRFLVVALAAIVQYSQSLQLAGIGGILLYILQKFSARMNVTVNVNEPRHQGIKEDVRDVLCECLGLSMLFTASSAGLEMPTDAKSLEAMLKRHNLVHRSYQFWEFTAEKIAKLVETSSRLVCKYILGVEYTSFEHIQEVEELFQNVMDLTAMEKQLQIGRDPVMAMQIELMYTQYLTLRRVYASNRQVMSQLDTLGGPLTAYYRRVSNKNPKAHVMRQEPVCFLITGSTGIGKSYLMAPLQQDLLKICGKFNPNANMEGLVYARCIEQEFWDGYCGQPIVIYDDFGQKVDTITSPNEEFFELIRSVNIFPYQLHSASLEDKANNPFQADFVCLTTNLDVFEPQSIVSTDALKRRFHLKFKLKLIEDVVNSEATGLSVHKLAQYRLKNNLPEEDMSHARFIDMETRKCLTYEEVVVAISQQYKKNFEGFVQRTRMAKKNAVRKLPQNAFSVDASWIDQPTFQSAGEPSTSTGVSGGMSVTSSALFNQSRTIRREFYQQFQPEVINADAYTIRHCKSVEEFRDAVRNWSQRVKELRDAGAAVIPPVVIGKIMMRPEQTMKWRTEQEFNHAIRTRYKKFIESPPSQYTTGDYDEINGYETGNDLPQGEVGAFYKHWRSEAGSDSEGKAWSEELHNWDKANKDSHTVDRAFTTTRGEQPDLFYNSRRDFFNIWRQRRNFNAWADKKFGRVTKFLIMSTLGIGVVAVCGKWLVKVGESHEFHKAPFLSTIMRTVTKSAINYVGWTAVPFTNGISFALAKGMVVWLDWTIIRDICKHGITHKEHVEDCAECKSHRETLEKLDKDENPMPLENSIATILEAIPEAYKVPQGKKCEQFEQDCEAFNEAYKVAAKASKVQLEGIDDQEVKQLFPTFFESGRSSDERKKKKEVEYEGVISVATENIISKCSRNMWWVQVCYDGVVKNIGNVFVLKGHNAIINYHFMQSISLHFKECSDKASFRLLFKQHFQLSGVYDDLERFLKSLVSKKIMRGPVPTEFFLFTMPSSCQLGADLTRHLVRPSDLNKLSRNIAVKMFTFEKKDDKFVFVYRDGFFEDRYDARIRDLVDLEKEHVYPESIRYLMTSKDGDCGSPVFVNSDMFERKILGFHYAGMEGKGISSVITLQDVEQLMTDGLVSAEPEHIHPVTQSLVEQFPLKNGSFFLLGETKEKIAHPCKSKIRPSAIQGCFGPPECRPALLAPPLKPDGPMIRALQKNATPVYHFKFHSELIKAERDYFKTCIAPHSVFPDEKRILTFEEACSGILGNQYFPPLKRSKSAGYPFMCTAKKGKTDWFGETEWDFDNKKVIALKELVKQMEQNCKQGIVPEVYFVATLKDEKRPNAKVDAGKTRVFSACPLHFSILFRKYFLGWMAFMTRNKIYNESGVGTNVHGKDWNRIVAHLDRWKQHRLIAGDFENFDGGVVPEIFERICNIVNNFYADGEENAAIRKSLFKVICQPNVIMDVFAFAFTHGQPSGNPSTAITNSVYVSLLIRTFYYSLPLSLTYEFHKHIRLLAYGDDNIIALSPWLAQVLKPHDIAMGLLGKFNVVYTRADKTSFNQGDGFQKIEEITFLKRQFVYDSKRHHWFAPLEKRSIREMCNWVRKSEDIMATQATTDNCDDAMVELLHHDEKTFNEMTSVILTALKKIGVTSMPPDYHASRDCMVLEQFMVNERPWV